MSEIRDLIRNLVKDATEVYSQPCKVISVDKDARTLELEPLNGDAKLYDVRLQSRESGSMGLVFFPKIDSEVIVSFLSQNKCFVSSTQDIEEILLKIDDFELFLDKENFTKSVKNITIDSENLEHTTKSAKFTTDEVFEVISSASAKITAQAIELIASTVDIIGVTNITGATTITGATNIVGAATISGAVSMGGGTNGGIPKGSAISGEIDKVITMVNKITNVLTTFTPVREDGGANLKALAAGQLSLISNVDTANLTNGNAVH